MSNTVAAILGALSVILWLLVWNLVFDVMPADAGFRMGLIVLVSGGIVGLIVYAVFSKDY